MKFVDNNTYKHIRKTLVRSDVAMYEERIFQIKKHLKDTLKESPALKEEVSLLKDAIAWYTHKAKSLKAAFPKSELFQTGTFSPHKDIPLFVPLGSFYEEEQMDEHLAKMIIVHIHETKSSPLKETDVSYFLAGLSRYLNCEITLEDVFFMYNDINEPNFLDKLITINNTKGDQRCQTW